MIDISASTVVSLLCILSASIFGYLVGGYIESDRAKRSRRQLHLELEDSYREADELRTIIFSSGSVRSQNRNPAQKLTSI